MSLKKYSKNSKLRKMLTCRVVIARQVDLTFAGQKLPQFVFGAEDLLDSVGVRVRGPHVLLIVDPVYNIGS